MDHTYACRSTSQSNISMQALWLEALPIPHPRVARMCARTSWSRPHDVASPEPSMQVRKPTEACSIVGPVVVMHPVEFPPYKASGLYSRAR